MPRAVTALGALVLALGSAGASADGAGEGPAHGPYLEHFDIDRAKLATRERAAFLGGR